MHILFSCSDRLNMLHAVILSLSCLFILIHLALQQNDPLYGLLFYCWIFLSSFIAIIGGADVITLIQWKEIKAKREKEKTHHLRNKC